ncbi:hypothetical protein T484DRAFT_2140211 [Baffinella frigidus]|nr:hypothetical protein T484DRAFT_2140211 [Cryptophyta sp. CCMP2293]
MIPGAGVSGPECFEERDGGCGCATAHRVGRRVGNAASPVRPACPRGGCPQGVSARGVCSGGVHARGGSALTRGRVVPECLKASSRGGVCENTRT